MRIDGQPSDVTLRFDRTVTILLLVKSYLIVEQNQILAPEVVFDLLFALAIPRPVIAHDKLDVEQTSFFGLEITIDVHALIIST